MDDILEREHDGQNSRLRVSGAGSGNDDDDDDDLIRHSVGCAADMRLYF